MVNNILKQAAEKGLEAQTAPKDYVDETDGLLHCGVCRALTKNYGPLSGGILSYDMAFLVLLLTSLYEPEETVTTNTAEETGTSGLLIAGIVAVLAAAAGSGFWFWKRRKIG